ncbi:rhamnulokinase [Candidatus Poribacteria bacterium]|nr:rhamnulokinase [Candidatus Poribacteria bacterium]
MAETQKFLAFDLGAESGRAVLGHFDGERIKLEELHRFPNGGIRILDSLHWDVLRLWSEMKHALSTCAQKGIELKGIGIDTWGVDFALIGKDDTLLGLPYHYRDSRTDGMLEQAFHHCSREKIFERSGGQFLQINTLYQLLSMVVNKSPLLEVAETFLMIPDLFNFWLTGRKVCEFTDATTTQFYDPGQKNWSKEICDALHLPFDILPEIVQPGTQLGSLLPSVAQETGLTDVSVIAPGCHDTASAVAAVPAKGENWAYISSGTWSLMGIETPRPIITDTALELNFTNEGGINDTFRFLKNIMGLWLVQECRRTWARAGDELSYNQIAQIAAEAKPFSALVDPDDNAFLSAGNMPLRIGEYCKRTGQVPPENKGEIVRCALESLALKYRWVWEKLQTVWDKPINVIHIVGGGSRNRLLCQFTADATGVPVVTGPTEATAIGNVMVQAIAVGLIDSISDAREIIRESFEVETYEPQDSDRWEEAYDRFLTVTGLS